MGWNVAKKLNIKDIAAGKLVGDVRDVDVEFLHNGKQESVTIRIKQLPFAVTEPLYSRLNKNENVFAEWVALALVDENNQPYLSKADVENNFTQALINAIFPVVIGLDQVKDEGKSAMKTNSGANSS